MNKRVINTLTIISSIIACITIICTFLTSYKFIYIGDLFNSYLGVQIILAITMIIWAIRFWYEEHGNKRYIYTGFCLMISVASIFFIASFIR